MAVDERSGDVDWSHFDDLIKEFASNEFSEEMLGFEQVQKYEMEIEYAKERLASGKLRRGKKFQVEMRLDDLEQTLARLKAGHDKVAKTLRQKALALAALPREMRDAIFENLYVQTPILCITWSRYGDRILFDMPRDEALYMSELHVGPQIAQEAAEIFYKYNTFSFSEPESNGWKRYRGGFDSWSQEHIDQWFTHDHYGSGITPQDFIRNIAVNVPTPEYGFNNCILYNVGPQYLTKIVDHVSLEAECDNESNYVHIPNTREILAGFQKYATLQNIKLCVDYPDSNKLDTILRILNPTVRDFRDRGTNVTFFPYEIGQPTSYECSCFFDSPSDEDYAAYYELTGRSSVFTDQPGRDTFETWRNLGTDEPGNLPDGYDINRARQNLAFTRVWLHEHHEVYKMLRREGDAVREIKGLATEIRDMGTEERDVRRRYYAKLLDFFG